jgi:hypothetical protein
MNENRKRIELTAVFLTGKIEQTVEDYAKSAGLPADELAERVVELLQLQANREILRPDHSLSDLRTNGTRPRQAAQPLALADGTSRNGTQTRRLSREGRESIAEAQRKRWREYAAQRRRAAGAREKGFKYNGTHWTQQPKNKARLRAQMKRVRMARASS